MILETAVLSVDPAKNDTFLQDFRRAQPLIADTPGFVRLTLTQCVERETQYLLLVWWETLAAHTVNFRQSPQYAEWKALLHHYYDPFPTVLHYQEVGFGM